MVEPGDALNEGSRNPADLLALKGSTATELYLVAEVQKVYKSQGVEIHDKHIELIVRQMLKKVRVESATATPSFCRASWSTRSCSSARTPSVKEKKEQATHEPLILGITKASLATESFLSAASFQETTKVLTDASIEGKIDRLLGLKENVIIGKLIPAATGLKRYRNIEITPVRAIPRETTSGRRCSPALEEIGSDGGGLDFWTSTAPGSDDRRATRPARRRRSPRSTRRSTRRRPNSATSVRREARETGPLGILAPTGTVPRHVPKGQVPGERGQSPAHVAKGQVRGKRGQSPAMS